MRKLNKAIISIFLAIITSFVYAGDNEAACKSVLCLSGGLASQKGFMQCAESISTYAEIRIYIYGKFIPHATAVARDAYLRTCTSADNTFITNITSLYGQREYLNIDL